MNVLILGDGADELAWAKAVAAHPDHTLWAAYPGFPELANLRNSAMDLDDALAIGGVDAAVVGGEFAFRAEALRRVASTGLPLICLHPPGVNADPYYQVALSDAETGAIVIPDLPLRFHPGFLALQKAFHSGELGAFRSLRHEVPTSDHHGVESNLLEEVFPTAIDPIRAILGEIDSVGATGDPIEGPPTQSLLVQLRADHGKHAEVRIWESSDEPARLILNGSEGSLTLEYHPSFDAPDHLIRRVNGRESRIDLEVFNPYHALLGVLTQAIEGSSVECGPNLIDGTRAMEVTEACARSLRRHRTIDLHYEEISETGNFKSVMTSVGCILLFGVLGVLPLALAGPAFGLDWTIYLAWAIPPILLLFIGLQSLKLAIKPKTATAKDTESKPTRPFVEMSDFEP